MGRIDWTRAATLEFQPVDRATFPLLDLAVRAGRQGGTAPAALNAANEEAVAAFLAGRLPFPGIAAAVGLSMGRKALKQVNPKPERTVDTLSEVPGALKPN